MLSIVNTGSKDITPCSFYISFNILMAAQHTLSLDIMDTASSCSLKITDTSIYTPELAVDCPRLDIILPGFTTPVYITGDILPGQVWTFSAMNLGLQKLNAENPAELPDGLYQVQYSVSPNEKVFVSYYHLRLTHVMNDYYRLLCKIQNAPCNEEEIYTKELNRLRTIRMYLDAAKAKVEVCHTIGEGLALFEYAQKLILKHASQRPGCDC